MDVRHPQRHRGESLYVSSSFVESLQHLTSRRVITVPPFYKEDRSTLRSAFLEFNGIDDARMALCMLDGRLGPAGETLNVGLSRLPAVHTDLRWEWSYEVEEKERRGEEEEGGGGGEADYEEGWEGLGFGTGREEGAQEVGRGVGGDASATRSSYGLREGRGRRMGS